MQIEDALARFTTQLQADGRSKHTIGQYQRHVRLLTRWLKANNRDTSIARIDHDDLAEFLVSSMAGSRPDGGRKKATSSNALRTSLRMFFDYVHKAGLAPTNAARLVRRARCGSPPPRGLSKREQQRLLDTLASGEGPEAQRDHLLVHLMLRTGIRIGSAVGLDVDDVDLESGTILLRTCKNGRVERVILADDIRDHLSRYLDGRSRGPLFCNRNDRRISVRHVQRRLRGWLQEAGIGKPASAHWLRHSFAMRLYEKTSDLALVKAALGHRSIMSTTVYARCDEARLRAALAS
jgi:integrase/recombinase XerD